MDEIINCSSFQKNIVHLENGDYILGELTFYTQWRILKNRSKKIKLIFQEVILLKMFLEAPSNYLTKEEIINKLWEDDSKKDIDCSGRLNMAISRLRTTLKKEDPRIKIVCDSKIGYTLCMTE